MGYIKFNGQRLSFTIRCTGLAINTAIINCIRRSLIKCNQRAIQLPDPLLQKKTNRSAYLMQHRWAFRSRQVIQAASHYDRGPLVCQRPCPRITSGFFINANSSSANERNFLALRVPPHLNMRMDL